MKSLHWHVGVHYSISSNADSSVDIQQMDPSSEQSSKESRDQCYACQPRWVSCERKGGGQRGEENMFRVAFPLRLNNTLEVVA